MYMYIMCLSLCVIIRESPHVSRDEFRKNSHLVFE
jgi:hypothetical protein